MGSALNAWTLEAAKKSPISIDKIEPNLFLGSLSTAINHDAIKSYKITHILTIHTAPLPDFKDSSLNEVVKKFIKLADLPNEDLLSHFDDTYNFISSAIESGGQVLVHCYFGMSRSASVVIAYFMKKYRMNYEEAFRSVKAKRRIISPNKGFVSQLLLYQEINFTLDNNYIPYKKFQLSIAARKVQMTRTLPQKFQVLIKTDPEIMKVKPSLKMYKCKKCKRILASESNLITHKFEDSICIKMYYFEPIFWMNVTNIFKTDLNCPNCNSKVGTYSWTTSNKCPCGQNQSPFFCLIPSEIEFSNAI